MLKRIRLFLAAASVSLLAACGGSGGPEQPGTITAIAAADPRFTTLVEAVNAAGLTDTLSGPGPFTVFAPTNDAFNALLTELGITRAALLANRTLLTSVLTYHVLPGTVRRANVPAGKAITTVQGGIFKVDAVGSRLVITDGRNRTSNITSTDIAAANGVIHVVDRVILPADKTIVQTAQATPDFSILVEAVVSADLAGTLSGTGPFTVFAPTNAAFAALLGELGITKEALLADKALLTKVLTYHVVPGRVLKADVPVGRAITTVQSETFSVDATLAITDQRGRKAAIVATDVLASNGVIHVIDKVILPTDKNIVQVAQGAPDFSILVEAVVAADLVGTLTGPGPFTVFAPTNAAFAALLTELGITKEALLADKTLLTKVLTYHVLPARVLKAGVPVGSPITTVQGETFTVDSTLAITDQRGRKASITATDLFATNGVVHVIDKVILPRP